MAGCPFLVDAVMAFKLPFCDPAPRLKRDPRQFVRRRSQKSLAPVIERRE
jgi:hypothetical protein